MLLKALQNLAAWLAEFGVGKFFRRFSTYCLHRPTQQRLLLLKLGWILDGAEDVPD